MRLLALAPNDWDGQWVNRQHLLSRIGRSHTVLYSTGGWHSWDLPGKKWRKASPFGAVRQANNVWVDEAPGLLVRVSKLRVVDDAVMRLQARRWVRWLGSRGEGPLVAHIFHPSFGCYLPHLEFDYLVYHPHDWFELMPGWNEALAAGERALLDRADLVLTPSEHFSRELQKKTSKEVRVLLNAADVNAFLEAATTITPEPDDLAGIPHPRIGYVGSLHQQVDLGLIATLARRHSDWHFVLVGKPGKEEVEPFQSDLEACRRLANVHLLGSKKYTETPRYVAGMDVNIMCYRLSGQHAWVRVGYPLKLNEYLAAGRPIVTADLEAMRSLTHVLRIAQDTDSWDAAIVEALAGAAPGTIEERRAAARQHSWDIRAAQLDGWLQDLVEAPAKRELSVG